MQLIKWELSLTRPSRFGPVVTAFFAFLAASFRSRAALQLEILALRHQIGILQRSVKRPKLTSADRCLWVWLSSLWDGWESRLSIFQAATVIGWHRKGFGLFWRWKIRHGKSGRPAVPKEVRELIRMLSRENPLWGAPHIHGELLKLGIDIGETSISKYMVRRRKPPSQTWRTFLDNHLKTLVSVDFFVVPTIRFQILYVFLVLAHERRRIVHFAVTAHPTAEWTAQQMREAFPWDSAPRYLLRDRDRIFGKEFVDQVQAMSIKQVLSAPRSPWQRAYVERVIGTIRRECLDHLIVYNERSLYRHLKIFVDYYHRSRTHLALEKDTPEPRPIQKPECGGIPSAGPLPDSYSQIRAEPPAADRAWSLPGLWHRDDSSSSSRRVRASWVRSGECQGHFWRVRLGQFWRAPKSGGPWHRAAPLWRRNESTMVR
jgi:putative transposase